MIAVVRQLRGSNTFDQTLGGLDIKGEYWYTGLVTYNFGMGIFSTPDIKGILWYKLGEVQHVLSGQGLSRYGLGYLGHGRMMGMGTILKCRSTSMHYGKSWSK